MGRKNKNKKFKELSSNESFGSHFRSDDRNSDTNRFGRARFHKYDRYSYNPFRHIRGKYFPNRKQKKQPSRPQSPILGSPEYTEKKIEQTSANIMRQLMNPNEPIPVNVTAQNKNDAIVPHNITPNQAPLTKSVDSPSTSNKSKKKLSSKEIEEIHTRIMCHLTNLNDRRKRNLINSNNSGYDTTIQHFVKQQRLEISRALRSMCSTIQRGENMEESNEIISSIIPDIGIKLEELPKDVIEKLSNTFGCDFNVNVNMESFENYFITDTNEVLQFNQFEHNSNNIFIKQEVVDSQNIHTSLEGAQKQLEKEIQRIKRVDNSEIPVEDDDVVVIDSSSDIIEINDDEDVKENVENVISVKDVKQSSSSTNLMEDHNVKPPLEMLDSTFSETDTNQDLHGSKRRKVDEVNDKEDCDELINKNDSVEAVKLEFEATEPHVLKKEFDDEPLNVDIDKNDKIAEIVQNVVEDLIPKIESNEKRCDAPLEEMEAKPLIQIIEKANTSTQTNFQEEPLTIDVLLEKNFRKKPINLSQAAARMMLIDQWVAKFAAYRQAMLNELISQDNGNGVIMGGEKVDASCYSNKGMKRKIVNDEVEFSDNDDTGKEMEQDDIEEITFDDIDHSPINDTLMQIDKVDDVIAVTTIFEDKLIAGSESGKIYICSLNDGKFLQILPIQSCVPITSIALVKDGICSTNMYIGTFRDYLHVYNLESYHYLRSILVEDSVECMDTKWGYIFIGSSGGWLQRYSIEREMMEYEEKFNGGTILALKATVEGPRRILLLASADSPVCIRDAMTGLNLRFIAKHDTYNVHSMIVDRNLIYCGTSKGEVLILSFHKGTMLQTAKIPGSTRKVCMKLYRNVLFISRDNDVNLYDLKTNKFIGEIRGPGGRILCMEIVRNQLIIGTNARQFVAISVDWSLLKNR